MTRKQFAIATIALLVAIFAASSIMARYTSPGAPPTIISDTAKDAGAKEGAGNRGG